MRHRFSLPLPKGYRAREVLGWHGRDAQQLSEGVDGSTLRSALLLNGAPCLIVITLEPGRALCRAEAPAGSRPDLEARLERAARGMLGLTLDPAPFEALARQDELLGQLVARQAGLRSPQAPTPWEALSWAIIGQQISVAFAVVLRRELVRLAGAPHPRGLWCFPDAEAVAALDEADLTRRKFSRAKAATLLRTARLVAEGALPLEGWLAAPTGELDAAAIAAALGEVSGIGPWTTAYTLLRGYGWPDSSLHGDAAVRRALERAAGRRLSPADAEALLARFSPFRSLAAEHLWASARTAA